MAAKAIGNRGTRVSTLAVVLLLLVACCSSIASAATLSARSQNREEDMEGRRCASSQLSYLGDAKIPLLDVRGCSDTYALGYAYGSAFGEMIKARMNESQALNIGKILTKASPIVRKAVDGMVEIVEREFPDEVQEIKGTAAGSGIPYEDLLLLDMWVDIVALIETDKDVQEWIAQAQASKGAPPPECPKGCSCESSATTRRSGAGRGCFALGSVVKSQAAKNGKTHTRVLVAHNDDNTADIKGRMVFVRYTMADSDAKSGETAPVLSNPYAGELLSSLYNAQNGLFSVSNYVSDMKIQMPGAPRAFLDRASSRAKSLKDFVRIVSDPLRAVGHVYHVADVGVAEKPKKEPKYAAVEAGPFGVTATYEPDSGHNIGTNVYKRVNLPNVLEPSSADREARGLQLTSTNPPVTPEAILTLLGDTAGASYAPGVHPIFRDGDPSDECSAMSPPLYTLNTVFLDSDARKLWVYMGNPSDPMSLQAVLDLDTMEFSDKDVVGPAQ